MNLHQLAHAPEAGKLSPARRRGERLCQAISVWLSLHPGKSLGYISESCGWPSQALYRPVQRRSCSAETLEKVEEFVRAYLVR